MIPEPADPEGTLQTSRVSGIDRTQIVGTTAATIGITWQAACAMATEIVFSGIRHVDVSTYWLSAFQLSVLISSAMSWLGTSICCAYLLRRSGRPIWWAFVTIAVQQSAIASALVSALDMPIVHQIGLVLIGVPCLLWGAGLRPGPRDQTSSLGSHSRTLLTALRTDGPISKNIYDRFVAFFPIIVTLAMAAAVFAAIWFSFPALGATGIATISAITSIVVTDLASRRNDRARLTGTAILAIVGVTVSAAFAAMATSFFATGESDLSAVNLSYACLAPAIFSLVHVAGTDARLR